jgi:N-acetylglucosaminyldiphosphoundecaprenol N-acetyl-beta-D-mannosaminyltransferase
MDIDKDFSRNVWCVLGLPFDAIDLKQTAAEILSAANAQKSCFLSTPNLNFLCAAQTDDTFREAVINSDLSIADGLPIVLVAKLLGIPLPERVAGSDLIEYLYRRNTTSPLKVFFFGGEPGAGELASQKINQNLPAGLLAVGHYAPGFGTVDEMSTPEIISIINQYEVEFLIVALGAKKGQAWIENNRHQLNAAVISHLGAVINFFAGSVKRAPVWMQRFGFEWLWRTMQEPSLWERYFFDGLRFLKLLAVDVFPYAIWMRLNQSLLNDSHPLRMSIEEGEDVISLKLMGACTDKTITALRPIFKDLALKRKDIMVDLLDVPVIDGAFLGLCLLLLKVIKQSGTNLNLINVHGKNKKIIEWSGASYLTNMYSSSGKQDD